MTRIQDIMLKPAPAASDWERPVRFMPSMNINMRVRRANQINEDNKVRSTHALLVCLACTVMATLLIPTTTTPTVPCL